ncbi:hypothetical protein FNYG_09704 [Fusarium nygamai]|uniref:Uncharacterized protein n=1 Tax=Gibberella nygamai TaxID=42673 RepID=A0A2K0W3T2_GIBNY|nr:hypothetical protein FNYG_09704 [Fusarium nygamai]
MKIYKAFSAVMLIRGITAGFVPVMSPVPKPPFKNETERSTAATLVTTITSDYSFYCPTVRVLSPTRRTQSPLGQLSIPQPPPGQPMSPTPPVMSSSAPAPPLPPTKATVPAAGTLPPPPPPGVSVPAPGSLPPPPSIPGQPAVPPSRAAPPSVNPTGTIEASVPSAAANKVSGSFGAFVLAGVAALAL